LTVISTFAGCGGSSLGYKWAGFRELLAIDFEPHAVETFRLNFPDVDVWQADIRQVTSEAVLARCNIEQGELDVLDGSPPCQGFSTAGKRVVNDTRNDLSWEFIRLIEGLKPRAFVMENVSGMAKGGMRGRFNQILDGLKATGYRVEVRKLNAMYYGVPQSRERIIFIGMRDGQEIKWPEKQKIITVREAIGDLTDEQDASIDHVWLNESLIGTKGYSDASKARQGEKYRLTYQRERWDRPASTITKLGIIGKPYLSSAHCHPAQTRTFSLLEVRRLCSFPDEFVLEAGWSGWDRLGNAVPPKMMQAIAEAILPQVIADD